MNWFRWRNAAAVVPIVVIVVLSLFPGDWQHRTGLPGPIEHVMAYFGAGLVLSLVLRGARSAARNIAFLVILSAGMELLQNLSPGRDPSLADILWGSMGAVGGVGLGALIAVLLGNAETDRR